jgi:probable phosphoglycerate mutase
MNTEKEKAEREATDPNTPWTSVTIKGSISPTPTYDDRAFPSAESWREFWERVSNCCNMIASDEAENIIIVSHGMTMSVWQFAWLGFGIRDFVYVGHPGGVCYMQVNDKGQRLINRWNDTFYMNAVSV